MKPDADNDISESGEQRPVSDPSADLQLVPSKLRSIRLVDQQLAHPPSPVIFKHRLAVNTFMLARIKARGLTHTILAQHLGHLSPGAVTQLFRGRQILSTSKYFDDLCSLLAITLEERAAIQQAEQRGG